jgi:hypothetical protein
MPCNPQATTSPIACSSFKHGMTTEISRSLGTDIAAGGEGNKGLLAARKAVLAVSRLSRL